MGEHELQVLLHEQVEYYRARASTYDVDMAWDSDDPALRRRLAQVFDWFAALPIRGRALELACGTGAWTRRLAVRADQVHAIDVAQMVEQARARVAGAGDVTLEVADLYRLDPSVAYDTVFFSFLLSHVPPDLVSRFWRVISSALADGGTVAFVDAAPHRQSEEQWGGQGVARRTLCDGSEHRIIKVPPPADIVGAMADHGLDATVDVLNDDFLVGVGRLL